MASISRDQAGNRRILFVGPDGKRMTIRLGKTPQRAVESLKIRVEQLLAAKLTGHAWEADLAKWIVGIDDKLAMKLAQVGLIPKPEAKLVMKLEPFIAEYIAGRADVKPASKLVWGHVRRNLAEHFGCDRDPNTITPGDADNFKQWLVTQKLAPTTIHKRLQFARTFFRAMLRRKLIAENPFEDVKAPAGAVSDRQFFVTREAIGRVLDACPNIDWRTIVVLARFAGLRTPSETLSVRWSDIDWAGQTIVVTSPKTAGYAGKETRTIPFFPELRPILAEAFELAAEGAEYVVDEKFRKAAMGPGGWANANLRTTFQKIVRRAGLQAWPRLFHNLRASRETELSERFPIQVVTGWLGNSPTIALRHYLMTTDEHFAAALEVDLKATQNPAQQTAVTNRPEPLALLSSNAKTPDFPGFAVPCVSMQCTNVEAAGRQLNFFLKAFRA